MNTIIIMVVFGVFMLVSFWLGVKAGMKEKLVEEKKFPKDLIDFEEEPEVIDEEADQER